MYVMVVATVLLCVQEPMRATGRSVGEAFVSAGYHDISGGLAWLAG